jgi:hypothetical protein
MRARIVLVGLVAILGVGGLLARADHLDVSDPNDTKGLLDVRTVKTFGSDRPGWRVITFSKWTSERIWDHGYVMVHLDTRGDERIDHFAVVSSFGQGMQGRLWRDRSESRNREIGPLEVWRTDKRSIAVRIPLSQLNIPDTRTFFRWYVETLWVGNNCPRTCFDVVPSRDGVIEPIGVATPTPTITPTPDPTPTP